MRLGQKPDQILKTNLINFLCLGIPVTKNMGTGLFLNFKRRVSYKITKNEGQFLYFKTLYSLLAQNITHNNVYSVIITIIVYDCTSYRFSRGCLVDCKNN